MNDIQKPALSVSQNGDSAMITSPAKSPYMAQLDALRTLAVFAVMYFHFYQSSHGGVLPWGVWGVQLFFVLSGFLITGILLNCRDLPNAATKKKHILKQFYVRRSLRIFPLFYFVIFLAALLNIQPVRATILWHLAYASNFYFALRGAWNGPISHLWSLAVEEQFYFVWPWLMLFVPRKLLLSCIIGAIALAPIYKIIGTIVGLNSLLLAIIMIACLDSLGIGALLAYFRYAKPSAFNEFTRHPYCNWLGVLFLLIIALTVNDKGRIAVGVINSLFSSLFFGWLIYKASLGFGGIIGKLLEWKPLLFLGKISYGLYVYHNFMPGLVPNFLHWLNIPWPENGALQFFLLATATVLVATCSWFLIEQPINNLKHRFEYST